MADPKDTTRRSIALRWLEAMSDQDLVELANAIRFYGELSDKTKQLLLSMDETRQPTMLNTEGKKALYDAMEFYARLTPAARQFMVASHESVFRWLMTLQELEVAGMQKRERLFTSMTVVGKFLKYLIIAFGAALFLMAQIGVSLRNIFTTWFGTGAGPHP
jgi:hypothetical protein